MNRSTIGDSFGCLDEETDEFFVGPGMGEGELMGIP